MGGGGTPCSLVPSPPVRMKEGLVSTVHCRLSVDTESLLSEVTDTRLQSRGTAIGCVGGQKKVSAYVKEAQYIGVR